jgi:hypothetical protein
MNLSKRARRISALVSAVALALAGVTLSQAGPAQASCSSLTNKSISGTLSGDDGSAVNALVGFTYVDELGYRLDIRGCRLPGDAYGRVFTMNSGLPATGAAQTSDTSNQFWVNNIPADVKEVWVETYPKGPNGVTNYARYAGVYAPHLQPGRTGVDLHFPVSCANGGHTGAIVGTFFVAGHQVTPSWIGFWGEQGLPEMGYGIAAGVAGGFTSPPLPNGQTYQVVVTWNGQTFRQHAVQVNACQTTHIRIDG